MIYISYYNSSWGRFLLASENETLIGLWFENQKHYLANLKLKETIEFENKTIKITKKWLDRFFNEENPNPKELKLNPKGTEFQKLVWNILCEIPYGKTTTYKEIAKKVATIKGIPNMSSQAIGNAISHNPISIIIPCHRVIGTNKGLTGYAGGIKNKRKLLELENHNIN